MFCSRWDGSRSALGNSATACRSCSEAVQEKKIAEVGSFCFSVKREWVMAEPDNKEVHTVSMMSLLGEGVVFGVAATVSPVVEAGG